jgi:conjugative relaxase-like TrwC/TraI family protein
MRMMGADSVEYHRQTVMGRADDYAGQALAYYSSRGETPLVWGGSGAARLGLSGAVTDAQYAALYGPGGASDPTTGARLVRSRRPGMEIVVAAHKSVAELGVMGRAEDMHRIMDAERDATLAYLDQLTRECGGRRGRQTVLTPTSGLVYAVTRHATSRAGDPAPHDHVLVANVVRMGDEQGGWKAAVTALWREHVHAATMAGRVAAAREAVRLGYAIVADDGPSGRLRHWAIEGIPEEPMAVHSKRAAEITAEAERLGHTSSRARGIIARDTRARKGHEPVGELMPRWEAELESVGWPVPELAASVEAARARVRPLAPTLDPSSSGVCSPRPSPPTGPWPPARSSLAATCWWRWRPGSSAATRPRSIVWSTACWPIPRQCPWSPCPRPPSVPTPRPRPSPGSGPSPPPWRWRWSGPTPRPYPSRPPTAPSLPERRSWGRRSPPASGTRCWPRRHRAEGPR